MPVNVQTHVNGLLNFKSGALGTIITSFDVWKHNLPLIEIHGTEGSLSVPDPNTFGGPVLLSCKGQEAKEIPLAFAYPQNSRGLGVADMARALREGNAPRAGGELAYHVLEIMHAFHESADKKSFVNIQGECRRPEAFTLDMRAL